MFTVRDEPANLGHQASDEREIGRPADVSEVNDQNIARLKQKPQKRITTLTTYMYVKDTCI